MRIILVEDEKNLATALAQGLTQKGYAVDIIHDGQKAYDRIRLNHSDYDIIVLDLTLPGMDGQEICKALRKDKITTPILILTANSDVQNKVDLLLAGADDYIIKPFSFDELCARIMALSRRPTEMVPTILKAQGMELDPAKHVVKKGDIVLALTLKEFVLLEYFMRNPNRVINREELLSHLWDFNFISFTNVVDVHIKNLRKKLASYGIKDLVETIRGVGYRLKT
ncbi:MAG: response regulator transcription factor [Patescibacteria group bacterium]